MSLYVGGERAKLYRGDYCPAQLYKGDVKIAGYTNVEKVGTSISGVETYNDALLPSIDGKSEQTVTANSPSPDYPEPIRSSENFDVVSCGRDTTIATTAHVTDPLRSVGNVSDSIEVSNGKVELVRRCATKMFDQSTPVSQNSAGDKKLFYIRLPELRWEMQKYGDGLCTHCKNTYSVNPTTDYLSCSFGAWGPTIYLVYRNDTSVKEIQAYLTAQATAGTPVTCQYQLATPTRTDITTTPLGQALLAMRTYPRYTQVYTNATLPPVIRAKIKEMEL